MDLAIVILHSKLLWQKNNLYFITYFRKLLYSKKLKQTYRTKPTAFSRNRKLPFSKVVLFMISLVKKSLQIELHSFMQVASAKHKTISNSAFNQARMKIKPELFKYFITGMNQEFYSDNDQRVKLWKGFRLLSVTVAELKQETTSTIYPNPFSENATLKFNKPLHNATLKVYNVFGQFVKSIKPPDGKEIILYRDNLADGFYMYEVSENQRRVASGKVVIQ